RGRPGCRARVLRPAAGGLGPLRAAAGELPLKSLRGLGRVWDRMTLYLPIILMGLLALGTYWLARNTPSLGGAGSVQREAVHEPDYFLRDFSVKTFDDKGRLTSEIHGTEA